jgi:hypothetical protein
MHSQHIFQYIGEFIWTLFLLGIGALMLLRPEKVFKGEATPDQMKGRKRAGVLMIVAGFLLLLADILRLTMR